MGFEKNKNKDKIKKPKKAFHDLDGAGFIGPCSCPCIVCINRGKHNPFNCPDDCHANPTTQEMIQKRLEKL